MTDFIKLTKMLLGMQLRKDKKRKYANANSIAFIILAAYFAAMTIILIVLFGSYLTGIVAETASVIMSIGVMMVLFFGTAFVLSYIYFSTDNEFLMSLPVKSETLFAAKFTVAYIINGLFSAIITLPGLLFLGIITMQGVLFYLMIIPAVLLVPLMPLLLAALIAIPLLWIIKFFKRKGLVATIVCFLFVGGILAAYFALMFGTTSNINGSFDPSDNQIAVVAISILSTIANVIYPMYALSRFMTMTVGLTDNIAISMLIDAGIFLGTLVLLALAAYFLTKKFYVGIALRQFEHQSSDKIKAKTFVSSTAFGALLKKEFRENLRNTTYAIQFLMPVIIVPIIVVFFSFTTFSTFTGEEVGLPIDSIYGYLWAGILFFVLFLSLGTNLAATTAISRDKKFYEISKTIPVDYSVQIKVKKAFGMIISGSSVLLSLIAMEIMQIVYGNYNPTMFILSVVSVGIYTYGFNCYQINRDLKKPFFDWNTPTELFKNTKLVLVPMLISLIGCLVYAAVICLFFGIGLAFNLEWLFVIIAFALLIGGSSLFSYFMSNMLKNNTEIFYNKVGDN